MTKRPTASRRRKVPFKSAVKLVFLETDQKFATKIGRRLGIKPATLKSWFASWKK